MATQQLLPREGKYIRKAVHPLVPRGAVQGAARAPCTVDVAGGLGCLTSVRTASCCRSVSLSRSWPGATSTVLQPTGHGSAAAYDEGWPANELASLNLQIGFSTSWDIRAGAPYLNT